MAVLPKHRDELIAWFLQRLPHWEVDPASVGLTVSQVASLRDSVEKAAAAAERMRRLRNSAMAATAQADALAADLRAEGGPLVSTIKAFAETTGDREVYVRAQVPPKRAPTPLPPAEPPTRLNADPLANGHVLVTWRGSIARHQTFDVLRSLDGGPFILLRNVRGTRLLDETVPIGTTTALYRVYGVRRNQRSIKVAQTSLCFGVPVRSQALRSDAPAQRAA